MYKKIMGICIIGCANFVHAFPELLKGPISADAFCICVSIGLALIAFGCDDDRHSKKEK